MVSTPSADLGKCQGLVRKGSGFRRYNTRCTKNAKVVRDGKGFCGTHDPVAQEEKREKQKAEWSEKWDREHAERDAREHRQKLEQAFLASIKTNALELYVQLYGDLPGLITALHEGQYR